MEPSQRILEAITRGDIETVAAVLASDPNAAMARNESGVSALLLAAYHRRWDMVEAIAGKGMPLDIWEASAAGRVARVGDIVRMTPALVDAVSPDGFSPLGLAAFFGREEVARILIEAGADVNAQSHNDLSVAPLHSAVASQSVPIVRALLEAHALVNPVQSGGFTPLHGAAFSGNVEIAGMLLASGADPGARSNEGKTPLAIALEKKQTGIAGLLQSRR
jgi:uncharacterized protein